MAGHLVVWTQRVKFYIEIMKQFHSLPVWEPASRSVEVVPKFPVSYSRVSDKAATFTDMCTTQIVGRVTGRATP